MTADAASSPPDDLEDLLALAAAHGLDLVGSTLRTEEVGLDFRVAIAGATDGSRWVLRIPRRAEVLERAAVEGELLRTISPLLEIAVPDWRIRTTELIAYPLLPGSPGLTVRADGTVDWHVDMSSPAYAVSLGTAVARLHAIDAEVAAATGIEVRSPAQVREVWARDLARVAASFSIAPELRSRWEAWIADDDLWPRHTVLTHGELYPGHTLVEADEISAIIDWTTASIGDPAKDLMFHQVSAPPEMFDLALRTYVAEGGTAWPRLAEHCTEMFSAGAIGYGIYALETGEAAHREAAAAELDPSAAG
ncbi:aminoglycoside phosphotransferase [Brachybacterium ginsengisoli]|uniref:Aminoglycoside phosphotransferase n=1 Tax=Brachybacterium ginsengisoli TaxID=1331682 RepID=A0A291GVP4_9MICO|nr:macrolide 2'-phosphotransferase [Brachybacterium ginsengisoli]ATG54279.1 aminoglycoside phosphotransferase [Brachybacterium ginsengisoli]